MTGDPRGICVIINNINFTNSNGMTHTRQGTELDEVQLKELFQELSFDVRVSRDLDSNEMRRVVRDAATMDHSQFGAFVFIVMSHGVERDAGFGVDGRAVRVEELMNEFKAAQCLTLRNKPKLFFIQSCRGSSKESLSPAFDDANSPDAFLSDSTLPRGVCPQEADFLLAFATVPGYVAWRDAESGSRFMQVSLKNI